MRGKQKELNIARIGNIIIPFAMRHALCDLRYAPCSLPGGYCASKKKEKKWNTTLRESV